MSLREQYGKRQTCWQDKQEPIFRFWIAEGCIGLPFFAVIAARYLPEKEAVSLEWMTGTVLAVGPKALEFFELFCANRATSLKADGRDIVSVEFFPVGLDAPKE